MQTLYTATINAVVIDGYTVYDLRFSDGSRHLSHDIHGLTTAISVGTVEAIRNFEPTGSASPARVPEPVTNEALSEALDETAGDAEPEIELEEAFSTLATGVMATRAGIKISPVRFPR